MKESGTNGRLLKITIKTFFGLEEVLKDELIEMGYKDVKIGNRSVHLQGNWRDVYYLNIHIRTGIAILIEIKRFEITNEKDLYNEAMRIDWTRYFTIDKNFAVKGAVFSDLFKHSQYPLLLVKDAIVDTFRKRTNERPSVELRSPQVLIDVYISKGEVIISLNTSGAPLFQRGYRESVGAAPLNEVVAAGLLRLSGWDKKTPLYDPFCGSGTFLIEAGLMSTGMPPSLERQHFAFKNFANYDAAVFEEIQAEIDRKIRELPAMIGGSDSSAEMVTKTRRNLRSFAFGRYVKTEVASFDEIKKPAENGIIITNPPYGERMGEEIEELYSKFGDWLKSEMTGWECWILSSNIDALKNVGLKAARQVKVFNGNLECSFRKYEMYEGSRKIGK